MFYRECSRDTTAASREEKMFWLLKIAMEPKVRFAGQHQSFSRFQSEYSRQPNLINTGRVLFGRWPSPFWLQLKSSQRAQERGFGSIMDAQPACFCGLLSFVCSKRCTSVAKFESDASMVQLLFWFRFFSTLFEHSTCSTKPLQCPNEPVYGTKARTAALSCETFPFCEHECMMKEWFEWIFHAWFPQSQLSRFKAIGHST